MTYEQIIKALECCKYSVNNKDCGRCPYVECETQIGCVGELLTNTLELIKRQKEEIERLKTMNSELRTGLKVIKKTEIKRFWEELKNRNELVENLDRFAPEHLTPLIRTLIEKQPTADVVKVVRCKDCDRSAKYKDYYLCGVDNRAVNADSFCSYGERRTDNEV